MSIARYQITPSISPSSTKMLASSSPIAYHCRDCLQLFDRLSAVLDESRDGRPSLIEICLDSYARYRIWANNIGARLTIDRRNSLDVRLQNAPKIAENLVEILRDFKESLEDREL